MLSYVRDSLPLFGLLKVRSPSRRGGEPHAQAGHVRAALSFDRLVYATHETSVKVGSAGVVLEPLLDTHVYNEQVQRTSLVGPWDQCLCTTGKEGSMTDLAMCIHGHFYQPPRENPFTGSIPIEPGAEPFRNFNEKVHSECYRPNAELGNFDLISFNFGPTLASWLQRRFPTTHDRIVAANRYHQSTFGVPNGMAQAYNHTILPLAAHRDKITQIAWGIADFCHRFGHLPAGMWLPEMAVDLDSLEAMARMGLRYTILRPSQVRYTNGDWVDSNSPCYIELSGGRRFTVFIRHEEMSNRLAFDQGLTASAHSFANWCREKVNGGGGFFVLAMDGETFGHHQPMRQHFLHSLLRFEAPKAGFRITTPEGYLLAHRQQRKAVLVENTAWSCGHGVARWSIGCSCTPGNQQWKPRLRTALDRLAGGIDALYQSECQKWIRHPWKLRDSYINVILGNTDVPTLLQQFSSKAIPSHDIVRLSQLLEAERYSQAMYTSCGWFFEDLSRIETRNNIGYAAMAIELVRQATGVDLSASFGNDLASAKSWITDENGRDAYEHLVAARHV
jgi:alpha-amylase/alpha-mannosidase (GH57 family)